MFSILIVKICLQLPRWAVYARVNLAASMGMESQDSAESLLEFELLLL